MPTSKASREALKEAREALKEKWRETVLTVEPLTPEEHQQRSGRGIRTYADNAGLARYEIEHFYKQTTNEKRAWYIISPGCAAK